MKARILIPGLLALVLGACSTGTAELILEQTTHDLGQVVNGEVRTLEIPLRSAGSSEVVIHSVTTSCGCTRAQVSPLIIPPGEGGILSVQFDSGAHGPDSVGPVTRQVFISSNDSDQPEIEFLFTADVLAKEP